MDEIGIPGNGLVTVEFPDVGDWGSSSPQTPAQVMKIIYSTQRNYYDFFASGKLVRIDLHPMTYDYFHSGSPKRETTNRHNG
jgi:hypothetical protein